MIVEDKRERIKCSFIEIELPFQQEASCSSTNRFIRRKASLAMKPRGSDPQPHLLKLGRWSHDNQDQSVKKSRSNSALFLGCFLAKDATAAGW